MARLTYSSESTHGKLLAEAVNHLIVGRILLARVVKAADIASNAGTVPAALESSAFGGAAGEGANYWTLMASVKALLDGADPGGLAIFLASMDNGDA